MSITYIVHNSDVDQTTRICTSVLTSEEEQHVIDAGFVVPQAKLSASALNELHGVVESLAALQFGSSLKKTYEVDFAGQYIRDPHRADPRIITTALLDFPLADTVRCLLGPRVALRNTNVRITHPGTKDSTIWHTDYRPHVTPPARLASAPSVMTLLIYLDPADTDSGPLFVMPGTHRQALQPAPENTDLPGQEELHLEPGQVVVMNAALWHRGGPNISVGQVRRLLTLQLSTIFMAPFNFEPTLPSSAYGQLVERARIERDEPLLELLGLGGINPKSAQY